MQNLKKLQRQHLKSFNKLNSINTSVDTNDVSLAEVKLPHFLFLCVTLYENEESLKKLIPSPLEGEGARRAGEGG